MVAEASAVPDLPEEPEADMQKASISLSLPLRRIRLETVEPVVSHSHRTEVQAVIPGSTVQRALSHLFAAKEVVVVLVLARKEVRQDPVFHQELERSAIQEETAPSEILPVLIQPEEEAVRPVLMGMEVQVVMETVHLREKKVPEEEVEVEVDLPEPEAVLMEETEETTISEPEVALEDLEPEQMIAEIQDQPEVVVVVQTKEDQEEPVEPVLIGMQLTDPAAAAAVRAQTPAVVRQETMEPVLAVALAIQQQAEPVESL